MIQKKKKIISNDYNEQENTSKRLKHYKNWGLITVNCYL